MKLSLHLLLSLQLIALLATLAPYLPDVGLLPCAAVPPVVYHAVRSPLKKTLLIALLLGYFLDRVCLAPTGLHPSLLIWIACGINLLSYSLRLDSRASMMLLSFFAQAVLAYGSILLLSTLFGVVPISSWLSAFQLPAMLACALLSFLSWPLYDFIDKPTKSSTTGGLHADRIAGR